MALDVKNGPLSNGVFKIKEFEKLNELYKFQFQHGNIIRKEKQGLWNFPKFEVRNLQTISEISYDI